MERDAAFIKHILDAIESIEEYTKDMDREKFLEQENKMARDAVVRQFEIIGEATKRLSEKVKNLNPDLPWLDIEGMRNKLIHEYFGVNMTVVWKTVESDLPILKKAAEQILESLK
ncbi:MAG: DUF86 domain-containing protein [Parcubacteria group bacterium]|nr:DUF86 domain-containing protein [Parcubacteria group bacterium]